MSQNGDKDEGTDRTSAVFTEACEYPVEEDPLAFYEVTNQSILEPIYQRFDEQLKLLHEQKIVQRNEAEKAECFRKTMEQIMQEFSARLNKTEKCCKVLEKETDDISKRMKTIEERAVLWDSSQDRLESVQAELVSEMYMQLQGKYRDKLDAIEHELAEQRTELHKLKRSLKDGLRVRNAQSTPWGSMTTVENKSTPVVVDKKKSSTTEFTRSSGYDVAENLRPVQRPMPYSGDSLWESYLAQFEITAQLNGWSDQQKAAFLATSLKGSALNVLSNLSSDRRDDYQALVAALESRFGTAHRTELSRVRFKNRIKQREESLAALSEDLERLGRMAYPDAPADVQNVLSRDQFIDALPEEDMRLRIKQERPKTLQKALELALELESFQLASRQRYYRTSREVRGDKRTIGDQKSTESEFTNHQDKTSTPVVQLIERLERSMRECLGNVVAAVGKKSRNPSKVGCWACGALDHIRRNCPSQRTTLFRDPVRNKNRDQDRERDHERDRRDKERDRRDQDHNDDERERYRQRDRRDRERDRDDDRKRDIDHQECRTDRESDRRRIFNRREYERGRDQERDFDRSFEHERNEDDGHSKERKDFRRTESKDEKRSENYQKLGSRS